MKGEYLIYHIFHPDGLIIKDSYSNKSSLIPYKKLDTYRKFKADLLKNGNRPISEEEERGIVAEAVNGHCKKYGIKDVLFQYEKYPEWAIKINKNTPKQHNSKLPSQAKLSQWAARR